MHHRVVASFIVSVVLNTALASADTPATGSVDVASQSWMAGWARDNDCPSCALWVHIYVDGVFKGAPLADQFRLDVGQHAFNFGLPPLPSGAHQAIAYAIGVAADGSLTGANPPLAVRTIAVQERRADFNGDGTTDLAVFRRNGGTWWASGQFGNVQWGLPEDVPVAADYDGDGRADLAVYRPSNGYWYIVRSSDGAGDLRGPYGGGSARVAGGGHVPVPGDYNGDGKAEPAVFRTGDSTWHAWGVLGGAQWGVWGDVPVPGDYDGDGKTDMAVYRPSNNTWYVVLSATAIPRATGWGIAGDIPVPADYDGDGKTDIAIFRPSTGQWWVILSSNGSMGVRATFGGPGDIPVPGDYNGDKVADVAVWRPSNGTWYVAGFGAWQWGLPGDIPAAHQLQYFLLQPVSCGDGLAVGAACGGGGVCNASGQCVNEFLRAGESLLPGQCRSSSSTRYQLCYRGDGVLAFTDNGATLWTQPESAIAPGRATLLGNGDLVVIDAAGNTAWQSGEISAELHGTPALQVLEDGDVVIDEESNLHPLDPGPSTPDAKPGTCDIELFTRNAFNVPGTVHEVVRVTRRETNGTVNVPLLNMQDGEVLGCNKITCNKQTAGDGCGSSADPFHDTRRTWHQMNLPLEYCSKCAEAYVADIGYAYSLADSNGAVNDCIDAIKKIDHSFPRPPPMAGFIKKIPAFRSGRDYEFPWQGGNGPAFRCGQAASRGCAAIATSDCPMVCGTVETHLCEYCKDLPECQSNCTLHPRACGCPDEVNDPNHGGKCGVSDECGHLFPWRTRYECGCPDEPNAPDHGGSCGLPDVCGHLSPSTTPYDCGCPNEPDAPDHPGKCGQSDRCGHPGGNPNDPGCCDANTACAAQNAACGTIWDGCENVECGGCDSGFGCTPEHQCVCTETTTQTCGWVTLCGRTVYLGDCGGGGGCASTCGQHPNDQCQPDGTCTCIGSCTYPIDCGRPDGCGNTCDALCSPCGDFDGDCYDDCTFDWVCGGGGGGGGSGSGSGGGSGDCGDWDWDCYDDCSGEWAC